MTVYCVFKGHTDGFTYFYEELLEIFREKNDAFKFIDKQLKDPDNYFDTYLSESEKLSIQEFEIK